MDRIAAFLESSNTLVRSAAAQALARTKDRWAISLLNQATDNERDASLQKKMETIAASLEKAP